MRDRIAKSVFWIVWSRGAVQAISFVSTILVMRLLSPADYGLMALSSIWTGTIGMLAELGLGAAIVQFNDLQESELNACFWSILGTALVGYLTLYCFAPAIASWFDHPALAEILRVTGWILPLLALRVVPESLLRKRLQLDKISQTEIVSALVTMSVVLALAWSGFGVWALVTGLLVQMSTQSVLIFWFVRWWPTLRLRGGRFCEVLRYSFANLGARICDALKEQADTFILGKLTNGTVLGLYSVSKQLAFLPIEKMAGVVNQFAFPVMAELQSDRAAMGYSFLRGVRLLAWSTFPLCIGMMLIMGDLVHLALSDKWQGAVPIAQLLCIYGMIKSIIILFPPVLMARYRAKFVFGNLLALLVVMPPAFFIGAKSAGATGVAAAWIIVYPMVVASMAREALRELGLSWKSLWHELRGPIAATLAMSVSALLARWTISSFGDDFVLSRMAAMIAAGALTYAIVLLRSGGQIQGEIKETLGWVFRPARSLQTRNRTG